MVKVPHNRIDTTTQKTLEYRDLALTYNQFQRAASLNDAAKARGTKGRHGFCVALLQDNVLLSTVFCELALDAVKLADDTIGTLMVNFGGGPFLTDYGNGECFDFAGVRVYVTVCPMN
jgi:hypothetical protein